MDKPCTLATELAESLRHWADQVAAESACKLTFDARGICQWAEDVENGTGSKLGAGWADMGHRGVMHGGHHKADAAALQCFFNNVCANHDVDSKFAERVGRA